MNLPGLCKGPSFVYFYSMIETSDLFALLDQRRAELGWSQAEVGRRAFGQADGSALQNIRRGSSPTFDKLQRLCEVLGLEVSLSGITAKPLSVPSAQSDDFAHIPVHQAALAAGDGATNDGDTIVDHLAFRKSWLSQIGVSSANAVLARAWGDSMLPSIHCGDMLLIDRSKRSIPIRRRSLKDRRPSQIYALLSEGKARVKRIERPESGLIILASDNPAFGPEILTGPQVDDLEIIGKVVWWGHTNRE